jgi:hypothetical protein
MKYFLVLTLLLFGCTDYSTEIRITQGSKIWEVCRTPSHFSSRFGEAGFYYEGQWVLISGTWTVEEIGTCTY